MAPEKHTNFPVIRPASPLERRDFGRSVTVQQEKIIRENRFQGGRKSALSGCNSHFHMYAKTPIRLLRGP
jgi:hypothetical protein